MTSESKTAAGSAGRALSGTAAGWAILLPVLAAISALLWWQADSARILEDTLQHIGVSRNVLRGEGLQTSLLYYDVQYAPGTVPAPQTVWPPGVPLALAAIERLGPDAATAALFLSWLSLAATTLLMTLLLTRVVTPALAGVAAAGWALSAVNWVSAAVAASELPFVACLLGATAALISALREPHRLRFLLLAGIAAAAAVSIRYVGVFFVATAGCVLLFALQASWLRRLSAVAAFAAIPAVVTAAIVARNFLATGQLAGGQFLTNADTTLAEALKRVSWSALELLALPRSGPLANAALLGLLGVGALAVAVVTKIATTRRGAVADARAIDGRRLLSIAVAYCGVTLALHLYWAMTVHVGMLDARYFEPLLPFVWITLAIVAEAGWTRCAPASRRAITVAVALCAVGYAWMQWQQWRETWPGYSSVLNDAAVARALETPFAGETVGTWLESADGVGPVVATLEHSLHSRLDHPVLGLPDSRYTARDWDERAVRELMIRYASCIVFFVPARFPLNASNARNLSFFHSLAAGTPPEWLMPVLDAQNVELYRRTDDACRALQAP